MHLGPGLLRHANPPEPVIPRRQAARDGRACPRAVRRVTRAPQSPVPWAGGGRGRSATPDVVTLVGFLDVREGVSEKGGAGVRPRAEIRTPTGSRAESGRRPSARPQRPSRETAPHAVMAGGPPPVDIPGPALNAAYPASEHPVRRHVTPERPPDRPGKRATGPGVGRSDRHQGDGSGGPSGRASGAPRGFRPCRSTVARMFSSTAVGFNPPSPPRCSQFRRRAGRERVNKSIHGTRM